MSVTASGAPPPADPGASIPGASIDLPCDALHMSAPGVDDLAATMHLAVNMVVLGTPPDRQRRLTRSVPLRVVVDGRVVHDGRATAVVVANGQYLRGRDLVPRGHPGDGRAEVQVYAVAGGERAAMRRRLTRGDHVPHPGIRQASGRRVEVSAGGHRYLALEVDGHRWPSGRAHGDAVTVTVRPGAFTLVT